MKLLFDDNISYRIVKMVIGLFPDCLHVSRTGLANPAPDRLIWEYARKQDYIIVTFDEDFENLYNLYGFPPKVIVLRLGNTSTRIIADTLSSKKPEIETFCLSDMYGLLEIF